VAVGKLQSTFIFSVTGMLNEARKKCVNVRIDFVQVGFENNELD
jgi:hypothetical protein